MDDRERNEMHSRLAELNRIEASREVLLAIDNLFEVVNEHTASPIPVTVMVTIGDRVYRCLTSPRP